MSCINCEDTHLFILSGQSNMARMPEMFFSNAINKEIGTNHTVFVKHAIGGMPIKWWDEDINGRIYRTLIKQIKIAIEGKNITTVDFIWKQGGSDVFQRKVDKYLDSFDNMYNQLIRDLGRDDIRLIVGQLNKWQQTPEWLKMEGVNRQIVEKYPNAHLILTDDVDSGKQPLHHTYPGYKTIAERYADICLQSICTKI